MANKVFYIDFTGDMSRAAGLSRLFDRLASTKAAFREIPTDFNTLHAAVNDSTWVDLLDTEAIEKVTAQDEWQFEDILGSVLNGEYHLVKLTFDGHSGRLIYDPWAYPFGGTGALQALVKIYGFAIVRDSFWDGFAEGGNS